MNLLLQFQQHFKQNVSVLFPANTQFIIAVSGGIDSVVLVDLFAKTNLRFSIAHCNFKLRNQESERDENFVKALAVKHCTKIFVQKFDTEKYATENKISIQIAARELRYNWFKELQGLNSKQQVPHTKNPIYLVTAHHSNDTIETVLFNFFRGTGIQGLTGINAYDKERKIVRPLLPFKKDDIINYAKENNIIYVEDSSNLSNKYTRNRFRNAIIPMITKHFANAEENILNNINKLNDVQKLYNQAIEKHKNNLVEKRGNELYIPILKLKKTTPLHTIMYEIIKDFSFTSNQTNEAIKLLNAHNGSYIQSASHKIINNRNWLIISPIKTTIATHIMIEKSAKKIVFENGILELKITNYKLPTNDKQETINKKQETNNNEQLNLDKLEYPLLLRKWKQGDYFYPLGMQKKQKLSKFFINQKLSVLDKEKVWVIESNLRIACIVGYRIDDRFKIISSTKNVLNINYEKTIALNT